MNSKNKNTDDSFEKYLQDYTEEYSQLISDDIDSPAEYQGKHEFSKKYEKWFEDLASGKIDPMEYNQKPQRRIRIKKVLMNIAAAIYILGAALLVVGFTVPPIRNAVLNYYINANEDSYEINTNETDMDNINETALNNDKPTPASDESTYEALLTPLIPIGNIPDGFILTESMDQGYVTIDSYKNADKYIIINRYLDSPNLTFDIDFTHEESEINNVKIDVFYDDTVNNTIFIYNSNLYFLESNISKTEIIEIVKSIIQ